MLDEIDYVVAFGTVVIAIGVFRFHWFRPYWPAVALVVASYAAGSVASHAHYAKLSAVYGPASLLCVALLPASLVTFVVVFLHRRRRRYRR
jgi:hypothetical protein